MLKRTLSLVVCLLASTLVVSDSARARAGAVTGGHEVSAFTRLEDVRIEAQGLNSLFAALSLRYDIPIGLEVAAYDDELATYSIDFKGGTLSSLLKDFTDRHDRYAWEINGGVVNVFPKDGYRDGLLRDLLDTKILRFRVNKDTSCRSLAKDLTSTPEVKKVLEDNGTSYRPRNFTGVYSPQVGRDFELSVSNMTLKVILNNVIKESPTAKFWFITRDGYHQTVFLGLNARYEDLPPKNVTPVVPQTSDR